MGKRGLRSLKESRRTTPFRATQKRKMSEAQRVRIWARHTFTGEFDQRPYIKILATVFVVLAVSGGLYFWAIQPSNGVFHSYLRSSPDPATYIYRATNDGSPKYNCFPSCVVSTITHDANAGPVFALGSNSTHTAVALSISPIDLSILTAKQLWGLFGWTLSATPANSLPFGIYLTTNGTLPTQKSYDPKLDSSVLWVMNFADNGGGSTTYNQLESIQTLPTRTIQSDSNGCTQASGSSCFLSVTWTRDATIHWIVPSLILNYTSRTTGGTCSGTLGDGCSSLYEVNTGASSITSALPKFPFTPSVYIGFYAYFGLGVTAYFNLDTGTTPSNCNFCNELLLYQPAPSAVVAPPNLDTGGFFGPIIKALVSIGVFIAQNIINFLNFLYNLLAPLLAGAATIIGNVLTAVFNALGSIFGDGSLGTQISTAFSNIVNYLTNVFASAVSIWTNILTGLLNILNFVVQFLTVTVSGGATLFNFIESFFLTMQSFWTVLVGVWNQFMKFYIAGTFTIQYILVGWWIWGMYENYKRGVKHGLIEGWLQPSETFLLAFFKSGYWFLDEAYKFVVQLKQLIFGNRISPGTIAGNG